MATWYIDNRLTTGANDGTSAANAWRSIYDCSIAAGPAAGDTIEFVKGSGPYYEANNQSASFKVRAADISFDAATKRIRSTASTFASFTAGHRIRVMGSKFNDGQYTVASVSGAGPFDLFVASSNNLIDEALGNTVRVVNIEPATATRIPFVMDQGRNGGVGNPILWKLNGCEVSAGWPLHTALHRWVESRVRGEWYCQRADGSNPSLIQPEECVVGGYYMHASAGDTTRQRGTPGALQFDRHYGYGDNDSLGYSTVYVKSANNPQARNTLERAGFSVVAGQIQYGIWQNWGNHTFRGPGLFSHGNGTADGGNNGACVLGRGVTHKFEGVTFAFADGEACEANASGPYTFDQCVNYWCGHRGWYLSGNITLNVLNCVDWGSHLGLLIAVGVTSSGIVNFRGNIIANNEAGAIDKKSSSAILNEGYNLFSPRFVGANAALGYISTANWTTTAATDLPPNANTLESDPMLMPEPNFRYVDDLNLSRCDWRLRGASIARGRGQYIESARGAVFDITGASIDKVWNIGAAQDPGGRAAAVEMRMRYG